MKTDRRFENVISCVVLLFAVLYISFKFVDTDLYYMIPTGKYLVENFHNEVIFPNLFTNMSVVHDTFVIQNWFYCIVLYFVNTYLHSFGLWFLNFLFFIGCIYCIFRFLQKEYINNRLLLTGVSVIIMLIFSYTTIRPEMLTFILIMVEILILENFRDTDNNRILWLMVPLMLIEINCHASYWILHYIVMIPYIIKIPNVMQERLNISLINKSFSLQQMNNLVPSCVCMFLVMFLNPYKWSAIFYVFDSFLSGGLRIIPINELQVMNLSNYSVWVMFIAIIIFLFYLYKQKISSVTFWMFIGFTFLLCLQFKWITFFALGLLYVVRDVLSDFNLSEFNLIKSKSDRFVCMTISTLLFVVMIVVICHYAALSMFSLSSDDYLVYNESVSQNKSLSSDLINMGEYLSNNEDKTAKIQCFFEDANYFEFLGYETNLDARPELYMDTNINTYKALKNKIDEAPLITVGKIAFGIDYSSSTPIKLNSDEYVAAVDDIDADYIVCNKSQLSLLYYYLSSHTDKYKYIVGDTFQMYEVLK